MLTHPDHPLADASACHDARKSGAETIIAHNDPSPARERVLRLYEQRHAPINIRIALPSLDGIKRAVEMGLGVAVLPRRCALAEIARGQLVAVEVPELQRAARSRLVFRRGGGLSHAAQAFLEPSRQLTHRRKDQAGLAPLPVRESYVQMASRTSLDLLVAIEQQAGRVPAAVEERLARGRRQGNRQLARAAAEAAAPRDRC